MNALVRVAVVGASGYAGAELVRLIMSHPNLELAYLGAHDSAGRDLAELYPGLSGRRPLPLQERTPEQVASAADVAFLSLPSGQALPWAEALLKAGLRVIDLSADFRLHDAALYPRWYKMQHTAPTLLPEAVYGLTEFFRSEIATARLIANPGCYPTATLLGLLPLATEGWLADAPWQVFAISGISGAGRGLRQDLQFTEAQGQVSAYGLGGSHRHTPEMTDAVWRLTGRTADIQFVPHLAPFSRGLLATLLLPLKEALDADQLFEIYTERYGSSPFVRVLEASPGTRAVTGTNLAHLTVRAMPAQTAQIVVAIDNIGKGAAGQALQNLNVMYGWAEETGLTTFGPVV